MDQKHLASYFCSGRCGKKKCTKRIWLTVLMDLEEGDHKSTSNTHGRSDPGKCCRGTRLQFLTGCSGRISERGGFEQRHEEGRQESHWFGGRMLWAREVARRRPGRWRMLSPGTCSLPWPVPESVRWSWEESGICLLLLEMLYLRLLHFKFTKTWESGMCARKCPFYHLFCDSFGLFS